MAEEVKEELKPSGEKTGIAASFCKIIFRGTFKRLTNEALKLKEDVKGLEFYISNLEKDITRVSQNASSADSIKFGLHEPFVVFNTDYLVTYGNEAFFTLMGYDKSEAVNKIHINEIFRRIEIVEELKAVIKEKRVITNFEMSFVDKEFRHVTGLFNGGPLLSSIKEVMGGYLMCRDITAFRMIINSIVDVANGRLQVAEVENKLAKGVDFITATEAEIGSGINYERDLKDKASAD
jgi:PAS domain-containing protein